MSNDLPPTYEHGDVVTYTGITGVVERRHHDGRRWQYGLRVPGFAQIIWIE